MVKRRTAKEERNRRLLVKIENGEKKNSKEKGTEAAVKIENGEKKNSKEKGTEAAVKIENGEKKNSKEQKEKKNSKENGDKAVIKVKYGEKKHSQDGKYKKNSKEQKDKNSIEINPIKTVNILDFEKKNSKEIPEKPLVKVKYGEKNSKEQKDKKNSKEQKDKNSKEINPIETVNILDFEIKNNKEQKQKNSKEIPEKPLVKVKYGEKNSKEGKEMKNSKEQKDKNSKEINPIKTVNILDFAKKNSKEIPEKPLVKVKYGEKNSKDAGYRGVDKRNPDVEVNWHVAMRPGKRKSLDLSSELARKIDQVEQIKASIRAKVEHPFRVIKCQFGHTKVRFRGLAKNTARLTMLFALSNLWMVRRQILRTQG